MKEKKPISGKISVHGNGVGVPGPEDIERRAREIAMIDERDPNQFTEDDWRQAREELLGELEQTPPEEDDKNIKLEYEWEVTPDNRGHRVQRPGADEEDESIGELLVTDGKEEAVHDQMIEARREELEQEGGIT